MNYESVRQNITVTVNSLEDSTLCVDVVSFFFFLPRISLYVV